MDFRNWVFSSNLCPAISIILVQCKWNQCQFIQDFSWLCNFCFNNLFYKVNFIQCLVVDLNGHKWGVKEVTLKAWTAGTVLEKNIYQVSWVTPCLHFSCVNHGPLINCFPHSPPPFFGTYNLKDAAMETYHLGKMSWAGWWQVIEYWGGSLYAVLQVY